MTFEEEMQIREERIKEMAKALEQTGMLEGYSRCVIAAQELIDAGYRKQSEGMIKVGDKVYQTDGVRIYESTVRNIIYDTYCIAFDESAIGKTVFLLRDEAEKKLVK